MEGFAIGAGIGVLGVVAVALAGYFLNYRMVNESHEAHDERRSAEELLKSERDKTQVLEKNAAALEKQVAALSTERDTLVAQLQAAENLADDLTASIKVDHPGALPDALRAQLDRLRSRTQVPDVPAAASGGDSSGGEAGAVHAPAPKGSPGRP